MKKIILSFASLMLTVSIFAQTPEAFTYQAIVRDNSGQPLPDAAVSFQFNILQGSATGTVVYSENQSATTNGFGLVNLQIGQGTVNSGTFSTIDWGNDIYFLNIQIDQGSGFVDMGTQQFLSVPYALFSKSTGNVDDADADPANEIQTLSVTGNQLSISGSGGNTITMNVAAAGNSGDVQLNDNGSIGADPDLHWDFAGKKFIVGQDTSDGRMIIQQDANASDSIPILEVKNKLGQTIFVVYPDSVHIFIDDDNTKGVLKGGFAVSGRSGTKAITNDYLLVRPDSTRIWTSDSIAGFGIRNIGGGTETSYMQLNPDNYFIGENSGHMVTTGLYNCTFGFKADSSLETGSSNIVIGYEAGKNNIWGSENVFMGYQSGYSNSVGGQNVFIGYQSGYTYSGQFGAVCIGTGAGKYSSGPDNVMIGRNAGANSTSGSNNVFVGAGAGGNFTGGNSVVIGTNAGAGSGGWNTFLGCNVGANNTTGAYNLFAGWRSGNANTTGTHNIFLGYYSGHSTQTGNNNTFLGDNSGYSNVGGNGNLFLGYQAGYNETGSDKLYIANSNTTTPLIYGNFSSAYITINGNQNVSGNFHITNNPGTGVTPTNYVYQGGSVGSTSKQYAFAINDALWVTKEAWFDGDITCVSLTQTSDKRFKKNIVEIDNALEKVMKLKGVYYYWQQDKFPEKGFNNKRQIGFIAQDLEEEFPELVKTDENGYKSINYSAMSSVLVEAIKRQQQSINKLNMTVDQLKEQIEKLKNK